MKQQPLNLSKELPIIFFSLLPILYLVYIWKELPEMVPTHWNWNGEIDKWSSKNQLITLTLLMSFGTYISLTLGQFFTNKRWIIAMGDKFMHFKFALVVVIVALSLFILHCIKLQQLNDTLLFIIIGAIFMVIGNFMTIFKPNNIIGIRIKSTLNNDANWKHTHQFASKLWMIGGILTIVFSLLFESNLNMILFLVTLLILITLPIIYSISYARKNP